MHCEWHFRDKIPPVWGVSSLFSVFFSYHVSIELCVPDVCCLHKGTISKLASDGIGADEGLTCDTPDPHLSTLAAL